MCASHAVLAVKPYMKHKNVAADNIDNFSNVLTLIGNIEKVRMVSLGTPVKAKTEGQSPRASAELRYPPGCYKQTGHFQVMKGKSRLRIGKAQSMMEDKILHSLYKYLV